MNPQMARHLYNETCCKGTGEKNEFGEEMKVTSPLWGAAISAGVPASLFTGHTKEVGPIEARKRVAQFLRGWADAIENEEKVLKGE